MTPREQDPNAGPLLALKPVQPLGWMRWPLGQTDHTPAFLLAALSCNQGDKAVANGSDRVTTEIDPRTLNNGEQV